MLTRNEFIKGGITGLASLTAAGMMASAGLASESKSVSASESASASASADTSVSASASATEGNRVCELLGIEKPVIQAPMSALTSPELVAAVSEAGGLGLLGMATAEDIEATKALTDKPFGATSFTMDDDFFKMLGDEGVNIVYVLGSGSVDNDYAVDTDTIKKCKDAGLTVLYRDVNCTVQAMVAAQDAGADIVIASGYGQGGHGTETRITLSSMLAEARPQITVPLVASGCIVDAATAAATAALGAEGAFVGTRFNASDESPCSDAAKQIIVDTRAEDLVEWRGILGFVRANDCAMSEQCVEMSNEGASREDLSAVYQSMWQKGMREGDVENWPVGMSDAVNSITSIEPVAKIVDDIASGYLA